MSLQVLNDFDPREDHRTVFVEIRTIEGLNKLAKLGEDGTDLRICNCVEERAKRLEDEALVDCEHVLMVLISSFRTWDLITRSRST